MTEITKLPSNGDVEAWTDAEKAIVEAAGLVFTHTYGDRKGQREAAPRPVVEQFLSLARRSGLDPLGRQIYCIGRLSGGRVEWSIQTGIDGFRLVAERSGKYDGQDPAEWLTKDGQWVEAFIPDVHGEHPLAARVRVYRSDWTRPSVGVAEWNAYAQKKSNGELNSMWTKQGPGQLAKCAEALAHRKAFPQDLSGLYTDDELAASRPAVESAPSTAARDWIAELAEQTEKGAVIALIAAAREAGQYTDEVQAAALARLGSIGRGESDAREHATPDSGPGEVVVEPVEGDEPVPSDEPELVEPAAEPEPAPVDVDPAVAEALATLAAADAALTEGEE
ncbi:phage recombination protein Bet [Leifsonia aquatica]|uniref:phage recombination protein Bet n=1 Tax=Leifsonia aquatica TaxID=144185 RepID=UPI00382F3172